MSSSIRMVDDMDDIPEKKKTKLKRQLEMDDVQIVGGNFEDSDDEKPFVLKPIEQIHETTGVQWSTVQDDDDIPASSLFKKRPLAAAARGSIQPITKSKINKNDDSPKGILIASKKKVMSPRAKKK